MHVNMQTVAPFAGAAAVPVEGVALKVVIVNAAAWCARLVICGERPRSRVSQRSREHWNVVV